MTHAFTREIPHWIGLLTDVGQVPEFSALTGGIGFLITCRPLGEVVNTDPGTEIRGFSFCDTSIISEP